MQPSDSLVPGQLKKQLKKPRNPVEVFLFMARQCFRGAQRPHSHADLDGVAGHEVQDAPPLDGGPEAHGARGGEQPLRLAFKLPKGLCGRGNEQPALRKRIEYTTLCIYINVFFYLFLILKPSKMAT